MLFLSGPGFWFALITLGITLLLSTIPGNSGFIDKIIPIYKVSIKEKHFLTVAALVMMGLVFGLSLLRGGLNTIPQSVSTLFGGIPYVQTPVYVLLVLLAYYPIQILIGLYHGFRPDFEKSFFRKFISLFFVSSVILSFLLNQRDSIIWGGVLLTLLFADWFFEYISVEREEVWQVVTASALFLVILSFIWFNLVRTAAGEATTENWIAIGAALVMFLGTVLLIIFGWSKRVGKLAALAAMGIVIVASSISVSWRGSHLGTPMRYEMIGRQETISDAGILLDTIQDIGEVQFAGRDNSQIWIKSVQSPALNWLLRNEVKVKNVNEYPTDLEMVIIVSQSDDQPNMIESYLGQDFLWNTRVNWQSLSLFDWFKWLIRREVPTESDSLAVWVRGDVFPGAGSPEGVQ
jgi:hypothetical protein